MGIHGLTGRICLFSAIGFQISYFSVTDNGSGINEKKLPMLFSGYFIHAEEQSGDVKRNMGIGLSVSLTIIKAHGGTMSAGNLPEGGAEFTFTLPLERAL